MPGPELLAHLQSVIPGAFELYHRTTYTGYRKTRDGGTQEIEIEILDAGLAAGDLRYQVFARAEGKSAGGNPAANLETAVSLVHWGNLD